MDTSAASDLGLTIDHIDIAVEDPDATAAFLVSVGCTIVSRNEHDGVAIELHLPGTKDLILELTPTRRASGKTFPPGFRHMALRCKNVAAAQAQLGARGVTFDGPPRKVKGRALTNVTDPTGHVPVQIIE
jgi:catechol 2,3-dioxygenase-like lactoylglutathione lyase family enzyme